MEYQRSANRELNELTVYLADAETTFTFVVVVHLAKAAIFALLDIAKAIRELRP